MNSSSYCWVWGPPVAWPRCNVLGNAISAIGELIVSIFYREEIRLVHSENVRTSAHYLPGVWCVHLFLSFKFLLFLHKYHFSFQTQHFPACKSNTRTIKIYPTEKMTKIHFYVDIWWVQPGDLAPTVHSLAETLDTFFYERYISVVSPSTLFLTRT